MPESGFEIHRPYYMHFQECRIPQVLQHVWALVILIMFLLDLDTVAFLLSSESTPIDKGVEQTHATPLHYAVQGGHEDCVQLLLDWGAKVNALTLAEVLQLKFLRRNFTLISLISG